MLDYTTHLRGAVKYDLSVDIISPLILHYFAGTVKFFMFCVENFVGYMSFQVTCRF